jgi:hypothetical protein
MQRHGRDVYGYHLEPSLRRSARLLRDSASSAEHHLHPPFTLHVDQALAITEDVEQKGAEPVGYLVVPVSIPGGTLRDLRRGEPLKLIFGRARPARQAATPAAEELPQE